MRNTTSLIATLCSLLAITVTPAEAWINQRQAHQLNRIAKGIDSGALTPHEAAALTRQQAGIARFEARSRADGPGLTSAERARIEARQDRASRAIYRQKHDAQHR